ncbi:MAG: hypothetical protein U0869_03060 [Chloroflexota bacterium]
MDGADWLRTQLTSFGCAACGSAFEPEGIRLVAERDGLFFVDLDCRACGSQATALVTIQADDDGLRAEVPEHEPVTPAARATDPVDLDDVLDVHQLLAEYQGDLVGLLRRFDGVEGTFSR